MRQLQGACARAADLRGGAALVVAALAARGRSRKMCIRDRTNSTKLRLEKLEAQQKELEVRIAEEKIARPRLSENQIRFWLTRFRKLRCV